MKAIVVTRTGGPETLEVRDVPEPQPRNDQVIVRVEAAGVNFADTMQAMGLYPGGPTPPFVPGLEVAGTIEGSGQRVIGMCAHAGGYAELVAVDRNAVLPIPEGWSAAEGAAFPVNYFTAYFAYWMADVKPDERVLIHAAAGGVGTAAVQLGRIMGVETFGTSSSDEKLAQLKTLGLDHGINYKSLDYEKAIAELTGGEGVDVVFEMLGGEHTTKSTRCLRLLGRLIVYGMATGSLPQFDFMTMFARNASMHALWLTPLFARSDLVAQAYGEMAEWAREGRLKPVIGHELPFEQAPEAFRLLQERRNFGKIVLRP
jgi:NADPH2:quinone reductase